MNHTEAPFYGGLALLAFAAILMLAGSGPVSAPITLLIVGIVLVADSARHSPT